MDNCEVITPTTTTTTTTTTTSTTTTTTTTKTTTTIKPNKPTAFDGISFATFAPTQDFIPWDYEPYYGKMTLIIELSTQSPEGLILSQGYMSNGNHFSLGGMNYF